MMKNIYQQQYSDYYMKPYNMKKNNFYTSQNIYQSQNINKLETPETFGFIKISVIDRTTRQLIENPSITIYATDGTMRAIPIMYILTSINPLRLELPVACPFGTQLTGPEYQFSTYNLRVDVFGYFANVVYNIRLFPNVTTDFQIEMTPLTQVRLGIPIEGRVDIPPHPRDIVIPPN